MNECIHGLNVDRCEPCTAAARGARGAVSGTMAGKSFALIYAPSLRGDTFLHLNREGDHFKFRWYSSPRKPAVELPQSGGATRQVVDLASVEILHEISYPYSTSPGGVSVTDSQYWFDEITKLNVRHGIEE